MHTRKMTEYDLEGGRVLGIEATFEEGSTEPVRKEVLWTKSVADIEAGTDERELEGLRLARVCMSETT